MIYRDMKTREISFPLGGIGSGSIGLGGNGRLIDWEIFNRPAKGSFNGMTHFAVRAEENGQVVDARILHGDLQPPYSGVPRTVLFDGFGWGPSRNNLCGMPHFRNQVFKGEYPMAEIDFSDDDFPGRPVLRAWSPFIPGNDRDSSLPAACFEVEITNSSSKQLDYTVVGVLANPWYGETAFNRRHGSRLTVGSGGDSQDFEFGDLTLGTPEENISFQEYWYRGGWVDELDVYWNDLNKSGPFRNRSYEAREPGNQKCDTGLLAVHFSLLPGATRKVNFVLTWHVPNRRNDWNPGADAMAAENRLENRWKNWYATQWRDSMDSVNYLLENYDRLRSETFCFHDALFNSTLPEVVLDGVSANLSILKSSTCLRLEDGTFYGWEGVGTQAGSCEGSCTHVWNYAQALPFLFPALERSMREANYRYSVDENGGGHFRLMLPLGIRARTDFMRPCVDGQFGDIMKTYRDWKISGDTAWLRQLWPVLKQTLEYAWSEKNGDRWDPDKQGVITGRQHHTLDMELFGPNAWLTGHYLGALKAASEMAEVLGEPEFAAECAGLFQCGRNWLEHHLFNGEYYGQLIDLNDRKILDRFGDAPERYWSTEHGEIKYQIGEGCEIDMHLPQWYASLYGLGEIYDPARNRSTLEAIFRHNFKSDMRKVTNTWRNYALNDEGGVLICAWPENRRKPVIPIPYASETMHGFEWALAAHMLMCGMREQAMQIITAIRYRYDGERRNPWNEFECGSNYARSMASYAVLHAFSGFKFDRTRGMIGFAPLNFPEEFRCFWSLGDAWGEYDAGGTITVKYGSLELCELELPEPIGKLFHGKQEIAFTVIKGRTILNKPIVIKAGESIHFQ